MFSFKCSHWVCRAKRVKYRIVCRCEPSHLDLHRLLKCLFWAVGMKGLNEDFVKLVARQVVRKIWRYCLVQRHMYRATNGPSKEVKNMLLRLTLLAFQLMTQHAHNVETTSIQRHDVESTLFQHCVPAGNFSRWQSELFFPYFPPPQKIWSDISRKFPPYIKDQTLLSVSDKKIIFIIFLFPFGAFSTFGLLWKSGGHMKLRELQCSIWRDSIKPSLRFSFFCVFFVLIKLWPAELAQKMLEVKRCNPHLVSLQIMIKYILTPLHVLFLICLYISSRAFI